MAESTVLQFSPFQSHVEEGFWKRLSSLKLNTLGLDETPVKITGFYGPCSHAQVSSHLYLLDESLPANLAEESSSSEMVLGNRNRCPIPGTLYNTNTLESFRGLDKQSLIRKEAKKIWEEICSGRVEAACAVLSRFLVISYADLKKWTFHYWFAFPALVLNPSALVSKLQPASEWFNLEEGKSLSEACNEWRKSSLTAAVPFFLVIITADSHVTLRPLKDWETCQRDGHKLLFGFYDPCHLPSNPGWPLRNFLAFICSRCKIEKIQFLCYRERHGLADLTHSLVGEALVSISQEWKNPQFIPEAVGWERNGSKLAPRRIDLATSMDPIRLAMSAADLNLKLMRWRALPSLNLDKLSATKCLLLGAGTLGCQVARMLMAWGIKKITLVDNGRVSMSNPLRQSLYTLEDCLNGGDWKADAAVRSLKSIFPGVEAEGFTFAIPMPGHPVQAKETAGVLEDCRRLQNLISSHDVIFLLTDTRESRWLPTLLCTNANKLAITAALGFDSYVVMRHGAGVSADDKDASFSVCSSGIEGHESRRLGCYFCNDVVAPNDSTSNRTLDQQCTVTRPGLAPIASALAVELMIGILHHPEGMNAPGEMASSISESSSQPLGILPHQIRGSLSQFSQMVLVGSSFNRCTACSNLVVSEYRRRELEFVIQALNHPNYLEDLTGLTELMDKARSFNLDWEEDDETDIETVL
ncbi:ubiquitin-like modifier-activating enzyme atg7 isoform X1 [Amborella trichopoda]|uniref:Ubiquitin-like modifier-activating enzyme ATG7 n=1 Tax=Amborella trichopoda TaxID=13333 RepID=U5D5T8_AMBTC|nr:ubiquitin-like modifier-activating enzyme atg7 isoform X1 [Amborella trichopoda]ERN17575.1 hypothetical protein AMTR_s00059p00138250 [Amborella trichopoda]|eukprot:XP_006856108.1 ubiquitin-like modifier-activating enzyme atg7 isoform X1 [Amborella trichopoda]